jgi:hypothetical protein
MSLDLAKLEKVFEHPDGAVTARCPACAEDGGDRKGEHLYIYPDGKYGCAKYQGDHEHRARIWELVGWRNGKGRRRPRGQWRSVERSMLRPGGLGG